MAKWIQNAIKRPGRIKEALGVPKGEEIPASKAGKLRQLAKKNGSLGAAARLAVRLRAGIQRNKEK